MHVFDAALLGLHGVIGAARTVAAIGQADALVQFGPDLLPVIAQIATSDQATCLLFYGDTARGRWVRVPACPIRNLRLVDTESRCQGSSVPPGSFDVLG